MDDLAADQAASDAAAAEGDDAVFREAAASDEEDAEAGTDTHKVGLCTCNVPHMLLQK